MGIFFNKVNETKATQQDTVGISVHLKNGNAYMGLVTREPRSETTH